MKLELFLNEISSINKRYNEIAQVTGENFNIFNILKIEREEDIHSKFIAMLLDPLGTHGKSSVFLRLFLKEIKIEDFLCENARVTTEKFIGFDPTHESGGRLDIFIFDGKKQIIIENKIDSKEHGNQLYRYSKENPHALLYLTLDGHHPENSQGLIDEDKYECISYKENIINWLEECIKETTNSPLLRETLRQYIILIKQLTGQARSKQMENEMIDCIINTEENITAYMAIYDIGMDKVFEYVIRNKVYHDLDTIAEKYQLDFEDIGKDIFAVDFGYKFYKNEWKNTDIVFAFGGEKMSALGFGIRDKDGKWQDIDKDNKGSKNMEKYANWYWKKEPETFKKLCLQNNDVIKTIEKKIKDLLEIVKDRGEYL